MRSALSQSCHQETVTRPPLQRQEAQEHRRGPRHASLQHLYYLFKSI